MGSLQRLPIFYALPWCQWLCWPLSSAPQLKQPASLARMSVHAMLCTALNSSTRTRSGSRSSFTNVTRRGRADAWPHAGRRLTQPLRQHRAAFTGLRTSLSACLCFRANRRGASGSPFSISTFQISGFQSFPCGCTEPGLALNSPARFLVQCSTAETDRFPNQRDSFFHARRRLEKSAGVLLPQISQSQLVWRRITAAPVNAQSSDISTVFQNEIPGKFKTAALSPKREFDQHPFTLFESGPAYVVGKAGPQRRQLAEHLIKNRLWLAKHSCKALRGWWWLVAGAM
jgi:hypothetical protein